MFKKLKYYLVNYLKDMLLKRGIILSRSGFSSKSIEKLEPFAVFTDSKGNNFSLLKGYRDLIKPGWQNMFKIELKNPEVNYFVKESALKKVKLVLECLRMYNFSLKEANILEIGCYGGGQILMRWLV